MLSLERRPTRNLSFNLTANSRGPDTVIRLQSMHLAPAGDQISVASFSRSETLLPGSMVPPWKELSLPYPFDEVGLYISEMFQHKHSPKGHPDVGLPEYRQPVSPVTGCG